MNHRVTWCAEIGSNHKGIPSLAHEMIREAALAGSDIVKFQLGRDPSDKIRCVDGFAKELVEWCAYWDVEFMASLWSMEGLELAMALGMKIYKIAHQTDNVLANTIMAMDVPVVATVATPDNVLFWAKYKDRPRTIWLWNTGTYPAYPSEHGAMPKEFGENYQGLSDHSHGIAASLLAVARGATFIERHFTLDRTEESIKDNHFASTPDEFGLLIRQGEQLAGLLQMEGKDKYGRQTKA